MRETIISILLVDDESAVVRHLKTLIEQTCEGFSVVAIAENGVEALALTQKHNPDIIITDVKMPVMNGLELVSILKEKHPAIPVIIVSGYQEFEFARKALDTGVVDYLIKPVKGVKLKELLSSLTDEILIKKQSTIAESLLLMISRKNTEITHIDAHLQYYIAVYRSRGLATRFSKDYNPSKPTYVDDIFILSGRDINETIYIGQSERLSYSSYIAKIQSIISQEHVDSSILLCSSDRIAAPSVYETTQRIFFYVDRLITPETKIVLTMDDVLESSQRNHDIAVKPKQFEFIGSFSSTNALYESINILIEHWKEEHCSMISIEADLRIFLHYLNKYRQIGISNADIEWYIDNLMIEAQRYDTMKHSILELIESLLQRQGQQEAQVDIPVLFTEIRSWIDNHYDDSISLSSVAQKFRISASYVSKLFRKYEKNSFNYVLTSRRIEVAKSIMTEFPNMPFKDVAQRVGYNDAFYFSRVFKAIEGIPPKEFATKGGGIF